MTKRNGIRQMIDKYILKFCGLLDDVSEFIGRLFAPRCKCKKNSKRTYKKEKDHGTDISFENEVNNGK